VFADELSDHISSVPYDCGFHLLMAPNDKPIPGLTVCVVKSFLSYYFSFPEAQRMYAEPDVTNEKSIRLLEKCGFKKLKTVEMSYKRAHVYCLERNEFFEASPKSR
jgi:RimJ/RimL family protein N-acetyltransferase